LSPYLNKKSEIKSGETKIQGSKQRSDELSPAMARAIADALF
jgi:hypothetical protein